MRRGTLRQVSAHEDYRGRALAFLREADRRSASRIEPFPGGAALLSPSFPLVTDANHVRLDGPWGGTPEELDRELELLCEAAGVSHRMVVQDDEGDAERLSRGLRRAGYRRERHVVMALRRAPDRSAPVAVEDVPVGAVAPVRAAVAREQPVAADQVVEQLLAWAEHLNESLGDRWLAALADGCPAACARVLSADGVGQVEDVATAPEQRGRGLATSVVLGGIDRLQDEGIELILIVADADAWPRELYAKLGFDPLAEVSRFRRL